MDAIHVGVVGLVGFLASAISAIIGGSESFVFSHVLADSCSSSTARAVSGILAGITLCLVAAFQYRFVANTVPPWTLAHISGLASAGFFVKTAWVSTSFAVFHRIFAGLAIFFSLVFLLSMLFSKRPSDFELATTTIFSLSAVGLGIVFVVSFFVEGTDSLFVAMQIVNWVSFCLTFFAYAAAASTTRRRRLGGEPRLRQ